MFVSTKDQGSPRRRSHPYEAGKAAQSSRSSLLSALTTISGASSGSASTVTQESYNRMQKDTQSKPRRRRRPREIQEGEPKTSSETTKPAKVGDVDVFEYLVKEKEIKELASRKTSRGISIAEETVEESEESEQDTGKIPEANSSGIQEDSSDPEGYYRGHLSDSGISMGSNSTGEPAHDIVVKTSLPPVLEETTDRRHSFTYSVGDSPYYRTDSPMTWYQIHGGGYGRDQIPLSPAGSINNVLPYEYASNDVPETVPENESSSCIKTTPLVFKDKHHENSPPPIFRSFSKINKRILLQMQANIAELEHELMLLDSKTASAETSPKHKKSDPNKIRRHTIRNQARREYLYQELHVSLDQYYQSLHATHRVAHITSLSTSDESTNFRRWLQTHLSPSSKLNPLLGDGSDLVSLKPIQIETVSPIFRIIAFSILVNVFFPLLVFKFISSILNRLIFLSLVMAAGSLALDRSDVRIDLLHRNCIIAFAGISVGAALIC